MRIQLSTDAHIAGDARLAEVASDIVQAELGHFAGRLSRVEVHLADENAAKGGPDDIRCTMEARPEGMHPRTVVHHDATPTAALRGGAKKLRALLDSAFGRLDTRG